MSYIEALADIIQRKISHMTKMLIGLILLTATTIFAERIDGPANIRQEIKGEIIFSLSDNVEVDLGGLTNDWYELVVSLTLTEKQFESVGSPFLGQR